MAGDWIKVRHDLPTDPAVIAIACRVDLSEDEVVGKLLRFWIWGDQQTRDGNAPGVTKSFLDRYLGVTGFADAMESAGWLMADSGGISIPNFERHISQSAKARALTSARVAKCKAGKSNGASVTKTLPEKRREEKSNKKKTTSSSLDKFTTDDSEFAKYLFARVQAVIPSTKAPAYSKWANQIRLIREQDGYTLDVIRQVFDWANADDFWQTNIRSPAKLRKHLPMLLARMRSTTDGKRATHGHRNESGRPAVKSIEA
jgi:hypothetical protein